MNTHVYVEFALSMVWGQVVALALRRLIWNEMSFTTAFVSGLMGGVPGWMLGATSADHLAWLLTASPAYRMLVVGGMVILFVAGAQRALSRENV